MLLELVLRVVCLFLGFFDQLPLLSILISSVWTITYPLPPLIGIVPHFCVDHPNVAYFISIYFSLESFFFFWDWWGRWLLRKERVKSELRDLLKGNVGNGNAGGRGRVKAKEAGAGKKDGEEMTPEDRYELLRACLEAEEDPWLSFLSPWFHYAEDYSESSTYGMDDDSVGVRKDDIGRENVAEWISCYYFYLPLKSARRSPALQVELDTLISLIEQAISASIVRFYTSRSASSSFSPSPTSSPSHSPPPTPKRRRSRLSFNLSFSSLTSIPEPAPVPTSFNFKAGYNPKIKPFLVYLSDVKTRHKPLLFYFITGLLAHAGDLTLWLCGWRHYGRARGVFPPPWMRGHLPRTPYSADGPREAEIEARKVGYWYKPGKKAASKAKPKENGNGTTGSDTDPLIAQLNQNLEGEGENPSPLPIVYFHGISGTYGPVFLLLFLAFCCPSRAIFVPEYPYLMMRMAPKSTILARIETVNAVRRALALRGFAGSGDGKGGVTGKSRGGAIFIGHSMGTASCTWIARDAPDLVAGTILVDPVNILLHHADAVRNFFRQRTRSSTQTFLSYFASERGIAHFMSRYLRWSDSLVLGPKIISPLQPASPSSFSSTTYLDSRITRPPILSPLSTRVFVSANDCIVPSASVARYCEKTGLQCETMKGLDHAFVLVSFGWLRRICKAVEEIGEATGEGRWR